MTTQEAAHGPDAAPGSDGPGSGDGADLRDLVRAALAARADLRPPDPHRRSLGLCVLEAVQAPRVPVAVTGAVLERYRRVRRDAGADPDRDGPAQVLALIGELGEDAWVRQVGTRHRVWPSPAAPLKVTATRAAAGALLELGITSTADLLGLADDARRPGPARAPGAARWAEARARWSAVPGQRSGLSWHWLHLLAGSRGVLPDVPARRAVAITAGHPLRSVEGAEAASAVEAVASALAVAPRDVDHALWRWEASRRARVSRGPAPP